jgi:hypothetical protein
MLVACRDTIMLMAFLESVMPSVFTNSGGRQNIGMSLVVSRIPSVLKYKIF